LSKLWFRSFCYSCVYLIILLFIIKDLHEPEAISNSNLLRLLGIGINRLRLRKQIHELLAHYTILLFIGPGLHWRRPKFYNRHFHLLGCWLWWPLGYYVVWRIRCEDLWQWAQECINILLCLLNWLGVTGGSRRAPFSLPLGRDNILSRIRIVIKKPFAK